MNTAPKFPRPPFEPNSMPAPTPLPTGFGRPGASAEPPRETTRRLDLDRLLRREPMPTEYFLG